MFGPPRACPVCNGFEFRPSKTGLLRLLALLIALRPYRCYSCGARVWRFSLSGRTLGKRWRSGAGRNEVSADSPLES